MVINTILLSILGAGTFNGTLIVAIIAVCLAAMGTLIRIFAPRRGVNDELLRISPYLKQIEKEAKERGEKLIAMKDLVNAQHVEVEKLKVESKNNTKSLSEVKQDNRDLVLRLDHLLKQFMEYMEGS